MQQSVCSRLLPAAAWRRICAHLVDVLAVVASGLLLAGISGASVCLMLTAIGIPDSSPVQQLANVAAVAALIAAPFIYFSVESGPLRATPGKLLFGLQVCRPDGSTGSAAQSFSRNLIKLGLHLFPPAIFLAFCDKEKRFPQDRVGLIVADRDDGGVISRLPSAALSKRFVASLIDVMVLAFVGFVLAVLIACLPGIPDNGRTLLLGLLLMFGVPVYVLFFETSWMMGTPGKRYCGLTLRGTQGSYGPIEVIQRNTAKCATLLFPPMALLPLFHSNGSALQDLSAVMVYDDRDCPNGLRKAVNAILTLGILGGIAIGALLFIETPWNISPTKWRKFHDTTLEKKIARKGGLRPAGAEIVKYTSDGRQLLAYLVKPAGRSGRKAAILYAHEGSAISGSDLSAIAAFVKAGYVVMAPTWRGEHGNPGFYEMCYGEVNDAEAALEFLSKQADVDSNMIFAAGHGVGGTIALLLAESNKKVKAVATCGALTDMDPPEKRPPPLPDDQSESYIVFVPKTAGAVKHAIVLNIGAAVLEAAMANQREAERRKRLGGGVDADDRVGPYADIPCALNYEEMNARSPLNYSSRFNCPAQLFYGQSPMRERRMHNLARNFQKHVIHKQVSVAALPADHNGAMRLAVPSMVNFFQAQAKKTK
jgi:uncharacterized RDD family membrane protein YckC/dienelactone hydrolase